LALSASSIESRADCVGQNAGTPTSLALKGIPQELVRRKVSTIGGTDAVRRLV
jgi:hypothetical protein